MSTAKTQAQKAPPGDAPKRVRQGRSTVKTTTELSAKVLDELQAGQRGAIDAVRKFMGSTDKALPSLGEGSSRRQEVIDSALEMTDRLVQVQHDFVRNVVQSAGETLSGSNGEK